MNRTLQPFANITVMIGATITSERESVRGFERDDRHAPADDDDDDAADDDDDDERGSAFGRFRSVDSARACCSVLELGAVRVGHRVEAAAGPWRPRGALPPVQPGAARGGPLAALWLRRRQLLAGPGPRGYRWEEARM